MSYMSQSGFDARGGEVAPNAAQKPPVKPSGQNLEQADPARGYGGYLSEDNASNSPAGQGEQTAYGQAPSSLETRSSPAEPAHNLAPSATPIDAAVARQNAPDAPESAHNQSHNQSHNQAPNQSPDQSATPASFAPDQSATPAAFAPDQAPAPEPVPAHVPRQSAPALQTPSAEIAPEPAPQVRSKNADLPIGIVMEISGSNSQIMLDLERLQECTEDADESLAQAGQVGSQLKIRMGDAWLLASVRNQRQDRKNPNAIIANIDFLGEGMEEKLTGKIHGFRRGVTRYPLPGSHIFATTNNDMRQIYASDGRANIQIGRVYPTRDIRASLYIDAMLGKHFALLGSTGTGKSTSAALLLHRICEAAPEGHIVMIDPHGEYSAAFKTNGLILDATNLQMPYWMLNFHEHCEIILTTQGADREIDADILGKCLLAARGRSRMAASVDRLTVDTPIPYLLSDLLKEVQDRMGSLDKSNSNAPYVRLKNKIEELRNDPRYQFMFSGMLVADTMAEFISRVFRLPSNGKPISIIDVSGVPSDITSTVVAVLSRLVFDYAIWGRDEKTTPILLVCEEAHRYVPNEKNSGNSAVGDILSRIAKEGRKYGISLGLITQRPSDLAEGVLSQCGTILSMRLNNERDQNFVKAAMPEGARGFLDAIPALRNRECIICGEGASIPMRVSFDNLEEEKRPASADPCFVDLWNEGGGEEAAMKRIIDRWRS